MRAFSRDVGISWQLGESRSWRTNAGREVRRKKLQVAQRRVQTALESLLRKNITKMCGAPTPTLKKLGL